MPEATLDAIKPGQSIKLTVTSMPQSVADVKTLERLMRFDPTARRTLARGQSRRVRELLIRSRGHRPWEVREKPAKVVRVEPGASWTMRFFPQIAPDIGAVAQFLKVSPA